MKESIAVQSYPNLNIVQEGGGIETSAAVPLTIYKNLLQSYERIIRVFSNWKRSQKVSFFPRAYSNFLNQQHGGKWKSRVCEIEQRKRKALTFRKPLARSKDSSFFETEKSEIVEGKQIKFSTISGDFNLLKAGVR